MYSAVIKKPTSKVFAVLDIGTTKIVCMIIKSVANNDVQVLGISYKESIGIYSGAIINAKDASACILSAVEEAEKKSEEVINEIYVNISGSKVSSQTILAEITDINNKVSPRDIRRIFNHSNENVNNKEVIIHNIPLEYILDNIKGIEDPIGMYGNTLKVSMHTVTIAHSVLLNLEHCVTQCQSHFKGCIISAYSSAVACITEDEKELGVAVIDIGGGSTSIGVFREGNLIYVSSVPVGGNLITRDIASAFSIDMANAEKLKVLKGNVILTASDQNDIMEVEKIGENNDTVQISISDLVHIIRPRVEEIFEIAQNEMKEQVVNRVVVTGGTSQLMSIRELASHILGCQVRIGNPIMLNGMEDYIRNPSLSAIIGSVLLIMKDNVLIDDKKSWFHKILKFIKGE